MSPTSPYSEADRLAVLQEQLQQHLQQHLKALESQMTREQQRQRDQVDEELHKMRLQLAVLSREQQQYQQKTLAMCRELLDELRKEVSEALHRFAQDIHRTEQHAETLTERGFNRLQHDMQLMLRERDTDTVSTEMLGDILITLGKQLHNSRRSQQT